MFARKKKRHIRHSTPSKMWTKSVAKIKKQHSKKKKNQKSTQELKKMPYGKGT